jgi:hypothetical protein
MYDASGGRARLNAIHLAAVLQQLSRLAPMPELAPAAETRRLKAFTAEVCCWWRLNPVIIGVLLQGLCMCCPAAWVRHVLSDQVGGGLVSGV